MKWLPVHQNIDPADPALPIFSSGQYRNELTSKENAFYTQGFPEDTSASIFTAGLLGEQYVALEPGGSMSNLVNGSHIQLTQSALVMEQIIGQFLYNAAAKKPEDSAEASK